MRALISQAAISRAAISLAAVALAAWGGGVALRAQGVGTMSEEEGVYVVAQIQIDDREVYRRYEAGFREIFDRYRGEMLSVSEDPELIEGEWPYTRTVLIRFPSSAALHDWYDSPEYQKLAQDRWAGSTANIVAVPAR